MERYNNCKSDEVSSARQFVQAKKNKGSLSGSDVEVIFCKKCGEVIRQVVVNPEKIV